MSKFSSLLTVSSLALCLALCSGQGIARAADYDLPPPPDVEELPLRSSARDWTGLHVGAFGAASCVKASYVSTTGDGPFNMGGCTGMGGLLAGMDYQIDRIVVGVEGDYGWSFSHRVASVGFTEDTDYDLRALATLRARLGYLVHNDLLLYMTGGAAWMSTKFHGLVGAAPNITAAADSAWLLGWVIGAGMETALSENLHLRAEYLYGRFKSHDYDLTVAACGAAVCGANMGAQNYHSIRASIVWSFSGMFF